MLIVTRFVPRGFDGLTVWPLILLRPECRANAGLIEHERVHWREQMFCLVLPWWVLYLVSRRFRLAAEVRAYRRQIQLRGISATLAAHHIATRYRLDVSFSRALEMVS